MNWLVHHEFGADQKTFHFSDHSPHSEVDDRGSLRYWLTQWLNVYGALRERHSDTDNVLFICYEDICSPTLGRSIWESLSSALHIPANSADFRAPDSDVSAAGIENLVDRPNAEYQKMREVSAERLGYLLP